MSSPCPGPENPSKPSRTISAASGQSSAKVSEASLRAAQSSRKPYIRRLGIRLVFFTYVRPFSQMRFGPSQLGHSSRGSSRVSRVQECLGPFATRTLSSEASFLGSDTTRRNAVTVCLRECEGHRMAQVTGHAESIFHSHLVPSFPWPSHACATKSLERSLAQALCDS